MKTKERQSYGHSGLTVELNLMDQYELTHLAERLAWHKSVNEEYENWRNMPREIGNTIPPEPVFPAEEIDKMLVFLNKLSLTSTSKATVFDVEEEEDDKKEA